jgi:3-hydroxyacyl-[acyl-carrier-protein] dehydratase
MPPVFLFDLAGVDLDRVLHGVDEIEKTNPHRGHMRMLDAITRMNEEDQTFAAFKDVRDDEFWVPGHIPGRPIFPGVLMIEAAAQLASFMMLRWLKIDGFIGFAAVDGVKFRGQVVPGDRFHLIGKQVDLRKRRSICAVQGLVRGTMVFEAQITGMPI